MNNLTTELNKLRKSDPDLEIILSTFEEIERVYADVQEAMWMNGRKYLSPEIRNSAQIKVSFQPNSSNSIKK